MSHIASARHTAAALAIISLLLAACGAQESATATPTITPTLFPTFAYVERTLPPPVATAAAATAAAATESAGREQIVLDPERVERGRDRYVALECGACHGDNGEGGDAVSLVGYAESEADFIDFMRSGGGMGNDHRFPTERLSNTGIGNLYQYLRSLDSE
jgi:mono/diheme cytochrome c family protein